MARIHATSRLIVLGLTPSRRDHHPGAVSVAVLAEQLGDLDPAMNARRRRTLL
jgi:hypothetical protein